MQPEFLITLAPAPLEQLNHYVFTEKDSVKGKKAQEILSHNVNQWMVNPHFIEGGKSNGKLPVVFHSLGR